MELIKNLFKGDKVVWVVFLILCLISLVEVFSATSTLAFSTGDYWAPFRRHCLFLVGGGLLAMLVQYFPLRVFKLAPLLLLISWVFLVLLQLGLGVEINDGARWFNFFGIPFQPSELAKMGLIITAAIILSFMQEKKGASPKALKYILWFALPTLALIAPDNLSTAVILGFVVYLMMIIGRIPMRQMAKLTGILLAACFLFGTFLVVTPAETLKKIPMLEQRGETWKNRILNFKDKEHKTIPPEQFDIESKENYQVGHANIAITSGHLIGRGPGNSKERDLLPQAYSDFIFAIILEELGLIPGVLIIFLYLILLIRTAKIANKCDKDFPAFMVMGIALLIATQALINMMVAVGLFPVTGQPLPLISRGGTSTFINCVYIGIILSVSRYNNLQAEKQKAIAEGDTAKVERLEEMDKGLERESPQK